MAYEHDALRRVVKVSTEAGEKAYRNEYVYHQQTGQLVTVKHNTDASTANDVAYTFEYDALGRKTKVNVGNVMLSRNVYQNDPEQDHYGTLARMEYGNGDCVRNQYDDFNRVTGVVYNEETQPRYEYAYNANGQVAHVRNNLIGQIAESEYDLANRPSRVKTHTADGAHVYTGEVAYDDVHGNLSEFKETVGEARNEYSTTFGYDEENRPTSLEYGDFGESTLEYDGLGRVAKATVKAGSGTVKTTTYTFVEGAALEDVTDKTSTTSLVQSISQTGGNFAYTYDDNGNITSVVQDGVTTSYTYDALGQLVRVVDGQEGATWEYTYDQGGNILTKKKYVNGVETESMDFEYTNENWRDQLTKVNDKTITYDQIGNPLNDGEWTYTWQNGRQLARMQKDGVDASFVYNENGLRVQKTVNGVVTKYTLHGKNVVHMTQGNDELHFFYDASNKPAVMVYNGAPYSYVKNLQGDIVAILDANGAVAVSYVYDAWGRPISCSGTMANTLGKINPFRYRGYVYDEGTGLYYLRSRYYCVNWCRFLNADTVFHGEGMPITAHLFSYCDNSPLITTDEDGQVWVMGVYAAYYGYFHNLTQRLVAGCNPGMKVEVPINHKGWRADLIYNGAIYEVKPKRDIHIVIGTAQVARYVSNSSYTAGVAPLVLPESFSWQAGDRTITMNFEQQGSLILYSFEIKKTKEQKPEQTVPGTVPVTVPAENPAESRKRTKPSLPPLDPVYASNTTGALAMTALLGGAALCLAYCFSDSPRLNVAR